MPRVTFTVNCTPEQYRQMEEHYGKGNISPCIMRAVNNDINGRAAEIEGILPQMKEHIRLAVAAGKSRPDAEVDFGRVFPTELWVSASGGKD